MGGDWWDERIDHEEMRDTERGPVEESDEGRGNRAEERGVKDMGQVVKDMGQVGKEGVEGGWNGARHLRVEPAVDLEQ